MSEGKVVRGVRREVRMSRRSFSSETRLSAAARELVAGGGGATSAMSDSSSSSPKN